MYLDAVLDLEADPYEPLYNGAWAKTLKWLQDNPVIRGERYGVCVGETMKIVSTEHYLDVMGGLDKLISV